MQLKAIHVIPRHGTEVNHSVLWTKIMLLVALHLLYLILTAAQNWRYQMRNMGLENMQILYLPIISSGITSTAVIISVSAVTKERYRLYQGTRRQLR